MLQTNALLNLFDPDDLVLLSRGCERYGGAQREDRNNNRTRGRVAEVSAENPCGEGDLNGVGPELVYFAPSTNDSFNLSDESQYLMSEMGGEKLS